MFKVRSTEYAVRTDGGFTLFEVLVSLSILSIALVVILQLFSANMRNIGKSDEYVKATIKAESIMREILDGKLEEGSFSKTTEDGYEIDVTINSIENKKMKNLPLKLLEVELKIKWPDGIKERRITLNTMKVVKRSI